MPGMMKNQPMKDNYVGGLEFSLAKKMKTTQRPPRTMPISMSEKGPKVKGPRVGTEGKMQPKKTPKVPPREQPPYRKNKFLKPDKPMFGGKFGM